LRINQEMPSSFSTLKGLLSLTGFSFLMQASSRSQTLRSTGQGGWSLRSLQPEMN
jgi:hypothetical protein